MSFGSLPASCHHAGCASFNIRLLGSCAQVTLANVTAESVLSANDSMVIVVAGVSAIPRTGDVVIASDTGAQVFKTNAFAYSVPGAIESVSPVQGQGGTFITLTGTRFLGDGGSLVSASLKGVAATLVSHNNTNAVLRAGESTAGLGDIVLVADVSIVSRVL